MMQQGYLQYSNQATAYHHQQSYQQQQQQHQQQQQQQQQQPQQQYSMQQVQMNQVQLNHKMDQNQNNRFFKRQPNSDQPVNRSLGASNRIDSVPEAKKDFSKSKLKARYDSSQQSQQQSQTNQSQQNPTKVVSLRNIPGDLTDLQIALIGLQFGDVVNLLYIKAKGQALIDFSNVNEASEMIRYFRDHLLDQNNTCLKGVEAAHSSYQQLTIDNTNRAIQTMNIIQLAKQIKESSQTGGDACVIKALITNIVYPICIDALYQVFSKYGNVLKIILIQKNELGALIQMKDEIQVQQAISNLNGRNMYNTYTGGCNVLNLQISRHNSVDVKTNNSKTWDYTNPLLPIQSDTRLNGHQISDNKTSQLINPEHHHHPLLPIPGMNMAAAAAAAAAAVAHHPGAYNNTSPYMSQAQAHHQHAHQQMQVMQGPNQTSYNQAAVAAAAAAAAAQSGYATGSAVVQISNFPDQIANPDAIFTLFGVYGDILKVKIMYNRRDNALMQYKTYEQALNAVTKMDKVKLFDKVISVGFSKFPEIQLPIKNDGGLAKDYSTSPLHRFKKPGSKNFFNIYPPNVTLHLSNISQMTSQEQINELFSKYGTIKNFKWISKEGSKMALIELTSLEESVLALIALHNFQLNGSYLRVNFAKEYKYN